MYYNFYQTIIYLNSALIYSSQGHCCFKNVCCVNNRWDFCLSWLEELELLLQPKINMQADSSVVLILIKVGAGGHDKKHLCPSNQNGPPEWEVINIPQPSSLPHSLKTLLSTVKKTKLSSNYSMPKNEAFLYILLVKHLSCYKLIGIFYRLNGLSGYWKTIFFIDCLKPTKLYNCNAGTYCE